MKIRMHKEYCNLHTDSILNRIPFLPVIGVCGVWASESCWEGFGDAMCAIGIVPMLEAMRTSCAPHLPPLHLRSITVSMYCVQ